MMSQRVERTWVHTGGYGRFRGKWVKVAKRNSKTTLHHQSKVQSNTHAGFKLTYRVTKTFRTKVYNNWGRGKGN